MNNFVQLIRIWILIQILLLLSTGLLIAQSIVLRCDDYGYDDPDFYIELGEIVEIYGAKLTIGAVPVLGEAHRSYSAYQDSILLKFAESDDFEIAQHGFSHKNWSDGGGEFTGRLYPDQLSDISNGKRVLEEKIGRSITTFIPPWNAFDASTVKAVEVCGFKVISGATSKGDYSIAGTGISFVPFTIDLRKLRNLTESGKLRQDAVYVTLFHAYDFMENAKYYRKRASDTYEISNDAYQTSLVEFSDLLSLLNEQNVHYFTVTEIAQRDDYGLFSAEAIRNNRMNLRVSPPPCCKYLIPVICLFSPIDYI
nr:hypothetical protein [Candidatus Cloacimonadota bacterium]